MEPNARDTLRRGVRAAVYRACWRRLEGDESGAQALLACEVSAALSNTSDAGAFDDELVRSWQDEDTADFDRAVLISDLVARRRSGPASSPLAAAPRFVSDVAPVPASTEPAAPVPPSRRTRSPAIVDLLDGMFEQERRARAVG